MRNFWAIFLRSRRFVQSAVSTMLLFWKKGTTQALWVFFKKVMQPSLFGEPIRPARPPLCGTNDKGEDDGFFKESDACGSRRGPKTKRRGAEFGGDFETRRLRNCIWNEYEANIRGMEKKIKKQYFFWKNQKNNRIFVVILRRILNFLTNNFNKMKKRLKKVVIKNSNELVDSFLKKGKMKSLLGGSGYCPAPEYACFDFCPSFCSNVC